MPPSATSTPLPVDISRTSRVVKWANWTGYLDMTEDGRRRPTLEAFTRATGIRAEYFEDIDDNDSYINKVAPQLRAGQDIGRDIFVVSDWMSNRLIRDGLVQPLDLIRMPHSANLLETLKDVSFDPGRRYSLTWQSGFGGIVYHRGKVGREIRNLEDLWSIPELRGRITVLSEYRDTIGMVMQSQGVDLTRAWGLAEFERAITEIEKRIADGWIRRVKGGSYIEEMTAGNVLAGLSWSGDVSLLRYETNDDNWVFRVPESGGTLWSDNLMIPITSPHRHNACALMDYYYDPAVAALVSNFVRYICPVQGAQEEMRKIDPELAEDPLVFPSADFISSINAQVFPALSPDREADYSTRWQRVIGN